MSQLKSFGITVLLCTLVCTAVARDIRTASQTGTITIIRYDYEIESAEFVITSSTPGFVWHLLTTPDAEQPAADVIKTSGTMNELTGDRVEILISDLQPSTQYRVYFYGESSSGSALTFESSRFADFTTLHRE